MKCSLKVLNKCNLKFSNHAMQATKFSAFRSQQSNRGTNSKEASSGNTNGIYTKVLFGSHRELVTQMERVATATSYTSNKKRDSFGCCTRQVSGGKMRPASSVNG